MKVNFRTRLTSRLQNIIFTILTIVIAGLLAWMTTRYTYEADWTENGRLSLSNTSQQTLEKLTEPLKIDAYATPNEELRMAIKEVISRYQRYKSDIQFKIINPHTVINEVRDFNIQDGDLRITYQGKSEHLKQLSEQAITSALQRLARDDSRQIMFLEGHSERNPLGRNPFDMSILTNQLEGLGFNVHLLNFAQINQVPDNTSVLVIASPQKSLLSGEVDLINDYVEKGGSLLWLSDPTGLYGLEPLAEKLGIEIEEGIIIDPNPQLYGSSQPVVLMMSQENYSLHHPIFRYFQDISLFMQAQALNIVAENEEWEITELLKTPHRAWIEKDSQVIEFDEDIDLKGEFTIAVALERTKPNASPENTIESLDNNEAETLTSVEDNTEKEPELVQKQRVLVLTDANVMSNNLIGQVGNLDLTLKMFNWLTQDDEFINIEPKSAADLRLDLSNQTAILLGLLFLFILPLSLISTGFFIWLRRRKA